MLEQIRLGLIPVIGIACLVLVCVSAVQLAFVSALGHPLKAKKMAVPRLKLLSVLWLILIFLE